MDRTRTALLAYGGYYALTGVAPFVSRRAFEAVTGPKREWWLVQTVGVAVAAVGTGVLSAAAQDRVTPEVKGIATGCAVGLATIDVVYVGRRRIAPTYLADAAVQVGLLAAVWSPRAGRQAPWRKVSRSASTLE